MPLPRPVAAVAALFSGAVSNASGATTTTNTANGQIFGLPAANFGGHATITTPQAYLPVGVPFSITLRLETTAEVRTADGFAPDFLSAEAQATFGDSLTFALSGPVFGLPDSSYNVNSASAGIVDNQVIPEPTGLALLGAGMLLTATRRANKAAYRYVTGAVSRCRLS